jgi:hypothetical protein
MSRDEHSIFRYGVADYKEVVDIFQKKEPSYVIKKEASVSQKVPDAQTKGSSGKEQKEPKAPKAPKEPKKKKDPIVKQNIIEILKSIRH